MADLSIGVRVLAKGAAVAALAFGIVALSAGDRGVFAVSPEDSTAPAPPPAAASPGLAGEAGERIGKGLQRKLQTMDADAAVNVIVTMAPGQGDEAAQAAAGPFDVGRRFTIINGFSATMTRAQVEALARSPAVLRIAEDIEVQAFLQDAKAAFGVDRVHDVIEEMPSELEAPVTGFGAGICIIDTGIDATHEQLDDGKVAGFCDATNGGCGESDPGTTEPYDDHGHGTHVASIAGGDIGVAPDATLYGAKVLSSSGSGTSGDIIAGIEWCAAQASVGALNLSLGSVGSGDGTHPMAEAADTASEPPYNKVVALAAGNSGPAQYEIGALASAEKPITVVAVTEWLSPAGAWRKGLAAFSSRGPTGDERLKPDIAAPGVSILAAEAGTGSGQVSFSGTSMATPFIAGVAALMLEAYASYHPDSGSDPLTPAEVKNILADTAVQRGDAFTTDSQGRPKNIDFGWGEVDAYAAVATAAGATGYTPTPFPVQIYEKPLIADNTVWDLEFEVTEEAATTPLSVNVFNGGTWTCVWLFGACFTGDSGADFDAELYAPEGSLADPLVDMSTCEVDSDTQCGTRGRQETLLAEPSEFGGALPLGTWRLRVYPWDGDGVDSEPSETADVVITMGPVGTAESGTGNDSPTADFTFTTSDLTANFTDTSSDEDGTIAAWSWDFGDGNTSTEQNPSHTYGSGGTYTVMLTVTDDDGATGSASHDVAVSEPNQPPSASFGFTTSDLTANFTDISTDEDGTIAAWSWDFGDDNTSTEQDPSHTYAAGGTYTVTLTVTDDDGATDSTSQDVTVSEPANAPPTAAFTSSCTDLACDFDGSGSSDTDGSITSYDWNFGDGTTASGATVSHTYGSGGTYTVTLTVTDDDEATDNTSQDVTVSETEVLSIDSITPNEMFAGETVSVTITGSGFVDGMSVVFENGQGPAPSASNVVLVDSNTITADVTAKAGGPPRDRVWDVRVADPDGGSDVLTGGFTIHP